MKYILTILFSLALVSPVYAATATTTTTYSGDLNAGVSTDNGAGGVVVSDPTATPDSGTYTTGAQTVTLSAPGATEIRYVLNQPVLALTCGNGDLYNASTTITVPVSSLSLLRVIACYGSGINSMTTSSQFTYSISAPTPTQSSGGSSGGGYTPPANTTTLVGDINGDGVVDILDFNALLVQWGSIGTNLSADLNGDGTVGILDFNMLIINWTQTN